MSNLDIARLFSLTPIEEEFVAKVARAPRAPGSFRRKAKKQHYYSVFDGSYIGHFSRTGALDEAKRLRWRISNLIERDYGPDECGTSCHFEAKSNQVV